VKAVIASLIAVCVWAGCRRESGPALQIIGESVRWRIGDPVPATSAWFDGQAVTVTAARGEIVGLQVLHRGGGPVSLKLAAPGVAIRGYDVEAFEVRRPSTALYGGSHGAGAYVDGLTAAAMPTTDPAYFEIDVARDAAPATVIGELVAGGRTLNVALMIAPVTLPPLAPRVWAYEDHHELALARAGTAEVYASDAQAGPQPVSDDERACIALFRSYGVVFSPDVHLEDWPARKELLAGLPDLPVWIAEDPAKAEAQVKGWIAATAGTGQVPFAIPIDEPRTPEARKKVRSLADVVRAAGGGPTSFRFAVTDSPHAEYGDAIDLYISPRAVHLAGDRVPRWTYNGAPPQAGAMVLDAESPGMRTWGWIAWRWQIPIWYVWDATYWHDRHNRHGAPLPGPAMDPARDPVSFDDGEDHGNFDGVLALPGCRPTLRMAALRRGYQDLALLDLAAACDRPKAEALAARMVPRALGDAGEGGAPAWSTDDAVWETARRELIKLASCNAPASR
jgi:hypothetical protein